MNTPQNQHILQQLHQIIRLLHSVTEQSPSNQQTADAYLVALKQVGLMVQPWLEWSPLALLSPSILEWNDPVLTKVFKTDIPLTFHHYDQWFVYNKHVIGDRVSNYRQRVVDHLVSDGGVFMRDKSDCTANNWNAVVLIAPTVHQSFGKLYLSKDYCDETGREWHPWIEEIKLQYYHHGQAMNSSTPKKTGLFPEQKQQQQQQSSFGCSTPPSNKNAGLFASKPMVTATPVYNGSAAFHSPERRSTAFDSPKNQSSGVAPRTVERKPVVGFHLGQTVQRNRNEERDSDERENGQWNERRSDVKPVPFNLRMTPSAHKKCPKVSSFGSAKREFSAHDDDDDRGYDGAMQVERGAQQHGLSDARALEQQQQQQQQYGRLEQQQQYGRNDSMGREEQHERADARGLEQQQQQPSIAQRIFGRLGQQQQYEQRDYGALEQPQQQQQYGAPRHDQQQYGALEQQQQQYGALSYQQPSFALRGSLQHQEHRPFARELFGQQEHVLQRQQQNAQPLVRQFVEEDQLDDWNDRHVAGHGATVNFGITQRRLAPANYAPNASHGSISVFNAAPNHQTVNQASPHRATPTFTNYGVTHRSPNHRPPTHQPAAAVLRPFTIDDTEQEEQEEQRPAPGFNVPPSVNRRLF